MTAWRHDMKSAAWFISARDTRKWRHRSALATLAGWENGRRGWFWFNDVTRKHGIFPVTQTHNTFLMLFSCSLCLSRNFFSSKRLQSKLLCKVTTFWHAISCNLAGIIDSMMSIRRFDDSCYLHFQIMVCLYRWKTSKTTATEGWWLGLSTWTISRATCVARASTRYGRPSVTNATMAYKSYGLQFVPKHLWNKWIC